MSTRPSSNIRSIAALLLLAALAISPAFAESQGPNSPGVIETPAGFTSPDEAKVEDDVFAYGNGTLGNGLSAKSFGFSIPEGAIINGILAQVKRKSNYSDGSRYSCDGFVKLNLGEESSEDKADYTPWPLESTWASYGGPNDTWGRSWTPAQVNDPDFTFTFLVSVFSWPPVAYAYIDHMKVTVYYSMPVPTALRNAVLKGAVIR